MTKSTTRKWMLWGGIAIVLIAIICLAIKSKNAVPKDSVSLDVEVVDVVTHPNSSTAELVVLNGEEINGIIIQGDTKIYRPDGKRIRITDLKAGQRIQAIVGPDVFYEPYDQYIRCYKIKIYSEKQGE